MKSMTTEQLEENIQPATTNERELHSMDDNTVSTSQTSLIKYTPNTGSKIHSGGGG